MVILDPKRITRNSRDSLFLVSLPGPEKVPLLVRIAQNLLHSRMLSANGAKFAQFASNSLYLSTKD